MTNCYKCGHPTVFFTIICMDRYIDDLKTRELKQRYLCHSCSQELDEWFD